MSAEDDIAEILHLENAEDVLDVGVDPDARGGQVRALTTHPSQGGREHLVGARTQPTRPASVPDPDAYRRTHFRYGR
jgi:hypothetical protein